MPDYRSEKMDSLEGAGNARGRWRSYLGRTESGWLDLANEGREFYDRLPDELQIGEAASPMDFAELAGFWLAWHLAGGFAGLEREGWNRSTVFRKLRRFRAVFGEHPDTFRFRWLQVDFERAWNTYLGRLVDLGARQLRPSESEDEPVEPHGDEPVLLDEED